MSYYIYCAFETASSSKIIISVISVNTFSHNQLIDIMIFMSPRMFHMNFWKGVIPLCIINIYIYIIISAVIHNIY